MNLLHIKPNNDCNNEELGVSNVQLCTKAYVRNKVLADLCSNHRTSCAEHIFDNWHGTDPSLACAHLLF